MIKKRESKCLNSTDENVKIVRLDVVIGVRNPTPSLM